MIDFKGCHFPKDVTLMAIRWYVVYPLNYSHIGEHPKRGGIEENQGIIKVLDCS